MELKNGCEYTYVIDDGNGDAELLLGLWGFSGTPNINSVEEILGTPLGLQEVLRAMKKQESRKFYDQIALIRGSEESSLWDFTEPNLEDQKKDVKDFLYKIFDIK